MHNLCLLSTSLWIFFAFCHLYNLWLRSGQGKNTTKGTLELSTRAPCQVAYGSAAKGNQQRSNMEQATMWSNQHCAPTEKSRSVKCKNLCGILHERPLTDPLTFSFLSYAGRPVATLTWNHCCSYSQAEAVQVSLPPLCSHLCCCFCPSSCFQISRHIFHFFYSLCIAGHAASISFLSVTSL